MVYGGYATILHGFINQQTSPNWAHQTHQTPKVPPGSPTLPTLLVIQGPQTLLITEAACEIVFTTGVYLAGKQDRVHRGRRAGRSLQTLWLFMCAPKKYWGPTFRLMGGKFHQVFLMFQSPKPCLSEIPISIIFKTAP